MSMLKACIPIIFLLCTLGISVQQAQAQQQAGAFNFRQAVTDSKGDRYLIGEVQNTDNKTNVDAVVYFGGSLEDSTYHQDIGIVGSSMAVPFKIDMSKVPDGDRLAPDDMKVATFPTLGSPVDYLRVDYHTLHLDRASGAIRGMINNTSSLDARNVTVLAIAESTHASVLDVVQSPVIGSIPAGGSANFTLTPADSVSREVGYYSCFVAGQLEQNYTFTDDTGKAVLFELGGDGVFKNVYYDASKHSLNFDARGVFPTGGYAELMLVSDPSSFENVKTLTATINGTNYLTSIYSHEMIGGKEYKHISVLFPFGLNLISIQPEVQTPEYAHPLIIAFAAMAALLVFSNLKAARKFQFLT